MTVTYFEHSTILQTRFCSPRKAKCFSFEEIPQIPDSCATMGSRLTFISETCKSDHGHENVEYKSADDQFTTAQAATATASVTDNLFAWMSY